MPNTDVLEREKQQSDQNLKHTGKFLVIESSFCEARNLQIEVPVWVWGVHLIERSHTA